MSVLRDSVCPQSQCFSSELMCQSSETVCVLRVSKTLCVLRDSETVCVLIVSETVCVHRVSVDSVCPQSQ